MRKTITLGSETRGHMVQASLCTQAAVGGFIQALVPTPPTLAVLPPCRAQLALGTLDQWLRFLPSRGSLTMERLERAHMAAEWGSE